jgi:hypothetical protein
MAPRRRKSRRSRRKTRRKTRRTTRRKSRRSSRRSRKRITLRRGTLSGHGYAADKSERARRIALGKAVRFHMETKDPPGRTTKKELERAAALSVFRKLNVLVTFNRRRRPKLARVYRADRDWVKGRYLG